MDADGVQKGTEAQKRIGPEKGQNQPRRAARPALSEDVRFGGKGFGRTAEANDVLGNVRRGNVTRQPHSRSGRTTTPWTQVPMDEHADVIIAMSPPPQLLQPFSGI
jgi:hypothetical protein